MFSSKAVFINREKSKVILIFQIQFIVMVLEGCGAYIRGKQGTEQFRLP